MGGRISALKKKIDILKTVPTNQYLDSLKNEIINLKQEGQCKQVTIDSLEFDISKTEKRLIDADETIIKLSAEIQLLKLREQCRKDDIASLVDCLSRSSNDLKDANENIAELKTNIKTTEDKKIKNKIKKLFAS